MKDKHAFFFLFWLYGKMSLNTLKGRVHDSKMLMFELSSQLKTPPFHAFYASC